LTLSAAGNRINSGNELRFYRTDNAIYTQLYDGGNANGFVLDNRNGDGFSFQSAGTNQLRIASTGAATFFGTVAGGQNIRIQTTVAAGRNYIQWTNPSGDMGYIGYGGPDNKFYIANQLNDDMLFYTNSALRLTIAGSTGAATFSSSVGVAGAAATYPITVYNASNGTTAAFGGTLRGIRIDNDGTFSSGRSTIYGVDSSFYASYQPLSIEASSLALQAVTGGNVGIGTASPAYQLTLNKASNPQIVFTEADVLKAAISHVTSDNSLRFFNGGDAMTISSSLNVLIGTTTNASGKLQVLGADNTIISQIKSSSGMLQIYPYFSAYGGPIIQALDGGAANLVPLRIESSSTTFTSSISAGAGITASGAIRSGGGTISSYWGTPASVNNGGNTTFTYQQEGGEFAVGFMYSIIGLYAPSGTNLLGTGQGFAYFLADGATNGTSLSQQIANGWSVSLSATNAGSFTITFTNNGGATMSNVNYRIIKVNRIGAG